MKCECGCGGAIKEGKRFCGRGHNIRISNPMHNPSSIAKGQQTRKHPPKLKILLCKCGCKQYAMPGKTFVRGHNGHDDITNKRRSIAQTKRMKDPVNVLLISNAQKKIRGAIKARMLQSVISKQRWKDKGQEAIAKHMGMMRTFARQEKGQMVQTKLEIDAEVLIRSVHKSFKYVGDGTFSIDGKTPDFVSRKLKKVIEVDGYYWHSREGRKKHDKRRGRIFSEKGYSLLVIGEREFRRHLTRTENKLRRFVFN